MASKFRANGGDSYITDTQGGRLYVYYGSYTGLLGTSKYPISKYPEYYALYEGKRSSNHVCLSNSKVFEIIRDNFIKAVKENQGKYLYDIDQADGWDHCQCDNCKAKAEKYGTYAGVQMEFLNKIAEAVEKAGYNIRLRTYAYVYTLTPPKNIKPHKFLHFRLAPISADYAHPMEVATYYGMDPFYKQIDGWTKLTSNINIYDYTPYYHHPNLLFPNLHVIGPNIRFYADYKSIGYLCDDYYGGYITNYKTYEGVGWYHQYMSEYKTYLISKLLWNPYINDTYITREFLRGYYGPHAAPYIDQFLSELGQKALNEISFLNCLGYVNNFFTQSYTDHIKWLWDKALNGAKLDKSIDLRYEYNVRKSRIAVLTNEYRLFKDKVLQLEFTSNGAKPKITNVQREIVKELLDQCSFSENDQPRITQCFPINAFSKDAFINAGTSYKAELSKYINEENGVKISTSSLNGIVFPTYSGRLGYLNYGGYNYIDGTNGGIDALSPTSPHQNFIRNIQLTCKLDENTSSSAKVEYEWTDSRSYKLIKTFSVSGSSLTFETQFINQKNSVNELHPVWYFNFHLGKAEYVSWKWNDESKWNSRAIRDDTEYEFYGSYHAVKGTITIVDPESKRGISIQMPSNGGFTHLLIQCNKTCQRTSIYIYTDSIKFSANQNMKHSFIITPLSGQTADKATKEKVPKGSLERINVYDVQIPYNSANQGVKNSYMIVDGKSSTGRAMANPPAWAEQILLYLGGLEQFGVHKGVTYNITWYATCDLDTSSTANTIFYGRGIGSDGIYTMLGHSAFNTSGIYKSLPCKGIPITVDDKASYFWKTLNGCKTSRIERLEFIRLSSTPAPTPVPSNYVEKELEPWLNPIDPSDYVNPSQKNYFSDSKRMSSGTVAGIVIVVILIVVLALFAFAIYCKKRSNKPSKSDSA